MVELPAEKLKVALPRSHPLARRKSLVFSELLGLEILRLSQPFVAIGGEIGKGERPLVRIVLAIAADADKAVFDEIACHHAPVGGQEGVDIAGDQHLPDRVASLISCRKGIEERIAHFVPAFK